MRQSIQHVTIALTTHGYRTKILAWGWGRAFDLKINQYVNILCKLNSVISNVHIFLVDKCMFSIHICGYSDIEIMKLVEKVNLLQ